MFQGAERVLAENDLQRIAIPAEDRRQIPADTAYQGQLRMKGREHCQDRLPEARQVGGGGRPDHFPMLAAAAKSPPSANKDR